MKEGGQARKFYSRFLTPPALQRRCARSGKRRPSTTRRCAWRRCCTMPARRAWQQTMSRCGLSFSHVFRPSNCCFRFLSGDCVCMHVVALKEFAQLFQASAAPASGNKAKQNMPAVHADPGSLCWRLSAQHGVHEKWKVKSRDMLGLLCMLSLPPCCLLGADRGVP